MSGRRSLLDVGKKIVVGSRDAHKLLGFTISLWGGMRVCILQLEGVGSIQVFPESLCEIQEEELKVGLREEKLSFLEDFDSGIDVTRENADRVFEILRENRIKNIPIEDDETEDKDEN